MSKITAQAAGGLASATSTWIGAAPPVDGDTILIPAGTTVTWDIANRILGSKAAGVGSAIEVRGSLGSSGKLIVNTGITLTLRGFDRNGGVIGFGNTCGIIERYAEFAPQPGATILLDAPTDGGSVFANHGIITSVGTPGSRVLWSAPAANRTWNTAPGAFTIGATSYEYYDRDRFIGAFPLGGYTALSNAAGTGPGVFGDSSVSFSGQSPAGILATPVASIELVNSVGKYYVDHDGGQVYFYLNQVAGTFNFTCTLKRLTYVGVAINSLDDNDGHSATFRYSDVQYLGNLGIGEGALVADHKGQALAGGATRDLEVTNCRFTYSRGIELKAVSGTLANPVKVESNTWTGIIGDGLGFEIMLVGASTDYVSLQLNRRPSGVGSFFISVTGGALLAHSNWTIKDNTVRAGQFIKGGQLEFATWPGLDMQGNFLFGAGSAGDTRQVANIGGTLASPAVMHDNVSWRAMRILNYLPYLTIRDNVLGHNYHHTINPSYNDNDAVFAGIVIEKNLHLHGGDSITDNGYNTRAMIDGAIVRRNTEYDNTEPALSLNFPGASSVDLSVGLLQSSNLVANCPIGYLRGSDITSRRTVIHLAGMDYNDIYNPSVSDVSGGAINRAATTTGVANVAGVSLHNPSFSGAVSGKSLVFTRTSNTNRTLAFDGGTAVQLVLDSGTASSGPNDLSTFALVRGYLNDAAKSWSEADMTLAANPVGSWVHVHTGTGAGQVRRVTHVASGTQLVVVPAWTTPLDATSQYALIKGEVQLTGAAGTMNAGIDARLLPATSQTDAAVAVSFHQLNVNPSFVDPTRSVATWDASLGGPGTEESAFARLLVDPTLTRTTLLPYFRGGWTPTTASLATAGHDGSFVGAINPSPGVATQLVITQQPSGFASGSACTTPAVVEVRDSLGNVVTGWAGKITATKGAGTAAISGPTILHSDLGFGKSMANGVGTFYRVKLTGPGSGNTITFSAAGLTSATTSAITVTPATGTFDGPAELPRVTPDPTYPTSFTGGTTTVATAVALQAQINTYAAIAGSALNYKIIIQDGVTLTPPAGGFILPVRGAGSIGWIVIQAQTMPCVEGTRAVAANFTVQGKVVTASSDSCFRAESGSSHYQLVGFECTMTSAAAGNSGLIRIGSDGYSEGSPAQTTLALVPSYIGLARMYVHGRNDLTTLEKGVTLNGRMDWVVDSTITECHGGTEGKAIQMWNGAEGHLIRNNDLEGNDITIILGGGSPKLPVSVEVNADVTITQNLMTKPASWKGVWDAKNMIDTKNCVRVLIERNIIQNTWIGGQDMLVNLKGSDQDGLAPWSGSSDVTFRRNAMRNGGGALVIASNSEVAQCVPTSCLSVHGNGWWNINDPTYNGAGKFIQFGMAFDALIEHDTFVGNGAQNASILFTPDDPRAGDELRLVYRNVIAVSPVNFGFYGDNTGAGSNTTTHYVPTATFGGNYLGTSGYGSGAAYAGLASIVTSMAGAGFVTLGITSTWSTDDPLTVCAALALAGGSALKAQGTDGLDPGADMGALATAITGVLLGSSGITPPPAAILVFTRQPAGGVSGGLLSVQPRVESRIAGTTDATDTRHVTFTLITLSGGPGILSGTTSGNLVAGVFDPGNLHVAGAGVYEIGVSYG